MKLKTVPPDSLKPKAAEYLPLQKVTLCQAICSWWLLWILPVSVVIGYVSSLPMQRSQALKEKLADAKYAAFLRDVRHLDPETLQPLPDTHEN